MYHLFPLIFLELGEYFKFDEVLHWGSLPKLINYSSTESKRRFLYAYTQTYLTEGIWNEHLVRNLEPFRKFLEVAVQSNGKTINYTNIARDVGVSDNTIRECYNILEDTLLGFYLEAYQHSFRKWLSTKPKFYLFDNGIVRAFTRMLSTSLRPGTSLYGEIFEHFIILECIKLASYYPKFRS